MYHDYSMQKIMDDLKSPEKKNFILDTDAYNEIDDQFAITYAMLADNINVLAMTAAPFLNFRVQSAAEGMEKSYEELLRVNEMIDPDKKMNVPCYRGSETYMPSLITPVQSEAAENIIRIIKETDGIVYVAVIGCYTNVASALLMDPSIADKMVVLMVGSNCFECGTCNEFNLEQDRYAARIIFECGVPVIVLPAFGGTERLTATLGEVFYFLRGKAGKIGDYLCDIFAREEGQPEEVENGVYRSTQRVIWDLASVAMLRLADRAGSVQIVPARTISPDGVEWRPLNNGTEMIYVGWFNRNLIMSDFYTVVRTADLK